MIELNKKELKCLNGGGFWEDLGNLVGYFVGTSERKVYNNAINHQLDSSNSAHRRLGGL